MKHFSSVCVVIATAVAASSAIAANSVSCKAIEARIAQQAGEFVKVTSSSYAPAKSASVTPADFYQGVSKKNVMLHEIADKVWDLRTEMAIRNCNQAAGFTY